MEGGHIPFVTMYIMYVFMSAINCICGKVINFLIVVQTYSILKKK